VTPALKKTGQSILINVVAPPIIDRSEPICSGKNFPNPQKIPAPGLQRATHQIVFTRPRVRSGIIIFPTPVVGSWLLAVPRGTHRLQGVGLVNTMPRFMRSILFGMARLDKLHVEAQFDPPGT
jgi:hypothetical protein